MKALWLSLTAATLVLAPMTLASAQDSGDMEETAPAAAEEDDAAAAGAGGAEMAADDAACGAAGEALMPASAMSADALGVAPASRSSQEMPELVLGSPDDDFAVSQHDYTLRVGQSYIWEITSEGNVEYKFHAPEFFRNVWLDQIVISDLEIQMLSAPAWLEWDAHGTIEVNFQAVNPGRYQWWIRDLNTGDYNMCGTILVVP